MTLNASMDLLLEFQIAFPGEEPKSPVEYLKGGSKEIILKSSAFFLGFKPSGSIYDNPKVLLETFFSPGNSVKANEIYSHVLQLQADGTVVRIINAYSSLTLFELFFQSEVGPQSQSNEEFEINLFKAYLVLNSEFTEKQNTIASESVKELEEKLKVSMLIFSMWYPISDKHNYDILEIFATQSIKAVSLFKFLEGQEEASSLLQEFLNHFNKEHWSEYMKGVIHLGLIALKTDVEAQHDITVEEGPDFDDTCMFFDKLAVSDSETLDENDFKSIRAKPMYKIDKGKYRIIFKLFLIEKIYKGLYFLLKEINDKMPEDRKVSHLKGLIGFEFSEKSLLYETVNKIYPEKCIKIPGSQFDESYDGAPDYYLRKGNNILLFESKDFLIRADYKMSFDFGVYDEEFRKRLYYQVLPKGKEKPGAVLQLINNIRRLITHDFPEDKKYKYRDIYIYPILLTHDMQYDTLGFNDLMNYWFQHEVESLRMDGLYTMKIKPITVVNIDTLIYFQNVLNSEVRLHELLNSYFREVINKPMKRGPIEEVRKQYLSKQVPFSIYASNKLTSLMLDDRLPPVVGTLVNALFNPDNEAK